MEQLWNYIDNLHTVWVCVLVIILFAFYKWCDKKLKNVKLYETCPRCGWELPENSVFEDHCYGCKNKTFEELKTCFGNKPETDINDTGYEPKIEENEKT